MRVAEADQVLGVDLQSVGRLPFPERFAPVGALLSRMRRFDMLLGGLGEDWR